MVNNSIMLWVMCMFEKLLYIIFPPKCIFCGKIVAISDNMEICEDCYKQIPFFTRSSLVWNTSACCDDIICVSEYTGIIKKALIRYKFYGKSSYYRAFSKLLENEVKNMTNCRIFDIIVSVPLHKLRELERGYNQAHLISKSLSRAINIKEESKALIRAKNTNVQSLISSKSGRQNNVKDAFKVRYPHRVAGKSVLLVDDIMTTGYTIDECSRALKDAGAKKVVAAVIASGRKF